MMEDARLDRILRAGGVILTCAVLAATVLLHGFDVSDEWEFWTTGRIPDVTATPNALRTPTYLAVVACLGCWGVLTIVLGRWRAGIGTLLFATVALGFYFRSNGKAGLSPLGHLGLLTLFVLNWAWKPWHTRGNADKAGAQVARVDNCMPQPTEAIVTAGAPSAGDGEREPQETDGTRH